MSATKGGPTHAYVGNTHLLYKGNTAVMEGIYKHAIRSILLHLGTIRLTYLTIHSSTDTTHIYLCVVAGKKYI